MILDDKTQKAIVRDLLKYDKKTLEKMYGKDIIAEFLAKKKIFPIK